jgi:hypothetical protein
MNCQSCVMNHCGKARPMPSDQSPKKAPKKTSESESDTPPVKPDRTSVNLSISWEARQRGEHNASDLKISLSALVERYLMSLPAWAPVAEAPKAKSKE